MLPAWLERKVLKLEAIIEEDANRGKQFNILTQLWTHNLSTTSVYPCGDDDDIVM